MARDSRFTGTCRWRPSRAEAIRRLKPESARSRHTQVFSETPYPNVALRGAPVGTLRPEIRLGVVADLTVDTKSVESRPARARRGRDFPRFAKRPAIFTVQA